MNGRVYDPTLGRFLSADPNIDGAEDAQGYNRYSYVGNNPLGATDPTGYFSLKEVLPAIIGIVVTAVATVILGPASGAAFKTFSGFFTALKAELVTIYGIGGAAAGGFASGFSGSLINGGSVGDAFKAGAIGAAVGAATAWAAGEIGGLFNNGSGAFADEMFANWAGRTAAHGLVGGLAAEAQGGKFRHGFYASAASAGIMHIRGVGRFFNVDKGGWWIAARTSAAAAIGGTASALGGGKFANGALTSAFQHLFNAEAPEAVKKREEFTVITESYYALPSSFTKQTLELLDRIPPVKAFDVAFGFAVDAAVGAIDEARLIELQAPRVIGIEVPTLLDRMLRRRETVEDIPPMGVMWRRNPDKYRALLAARGLSAEGMEQISRVQTRTVMSKWVLWWSEVEIGKPLPSDLRGNIR